jgi:hypothetical protein
MPLMSCRGLCNVKQSTVVEEVLGGLSRALLQCFNQADEHYANALDELQ